jgi:hypothetical protein
MQPFTPDQSRVIIDMRFKLLTILVSFAVMLSMLSGARVLGAFPGRVNQRVKKAGRMMSASPKMPPVPVI